MTVEELKNSGAIIFESISGSRAYGLNTPTSDTDIKGVFILPKEQFYSMSYISQVNNESNDVVYYELRKFVELCANNNPNILELLNVPDHCVLFKDPLFDRFNAEDFLSKKCEKSFANYAYSQIKKARGLEKKIVNPMEKERKSVLDFCLVYKEGKSKPFKQFLEDRGLEQENCGLARIPNMKDCYNVYYSDEINYKGIVQKESANEVSLSDVPKGESPLTLMYFNLDGYSAYCKRYKEYWEWVEKRNEDRYQTTMQHGKNYDSKNMMHTFRLLHMAKEIALENSINVFRSDREFLLAVKNGEFEYDDLIAQADILKQEISELFLNSTLQEEPNLDDVNQLLVSVRNEFYNRDHSNK